MSPALRDIATQPSQFVSTRWTVVLAAGGSRLFSVQAHNALSELCRIYWKPLYLFLRREGIGAEDAQDLTQEFLPNSFAIALASELIARRDVSGPLSSAR